MFNPDSPFKKHEDLIEDKMDSTTQAIYKSQKYTLSLVKGRIDDMKPVASKHFEDIRLFIEGVEAGITRHWWEYYKRAEEFL